MKTVWKKFSLQALGQKLSKGLLDEENTFQSPHISTLEAYLKTNQLGDFLPYEFYESSKKLFVNRTSLGFVFELAPIMGCDLETHKQLSGIFQHILPEETNIQFLLLADHRIGDALQRWSSVSSGQADVFQEMSHMRSAYFKSLAHGSQKGLNARSFRCIVSVTRSFDGQNMNSASLDLIQIRDRLLQTFEMIGTPSFLMNPDDLMSFFEDIFGESEGAVNFFHQRNKWHRFDPISQQIPKASTSIGIKQNGVYLNEGERLIRGYSVKKYPRNWGQSLMGELLGDPMSDMLQIPCPFFIHYGVYIPSQDKNKRDFEVKASHIDRQCQSSIAKFIPDVFEQQKEFNFVRGQISENHRFVKTSFMVLLLSTPNRINQDEQAMMNLFRVKDWELTPRHFFHLQTLLTSLPMMWGENALRDLTSAKAIKSTVTSESANILPLQGEWYGTSSQGMLLLGRRGQLMTWSPFDSSGNYNVAVVGRSGSGKSVFMQDLMNSILRMGGRVFVLDVGRSFEKTCTLLKGQFIEFTPKNPISLNPFSDLVLEADVVNDTLSMLMSVLRTMAAPTDGATDLQSSYLSEALMQSFKTHQRQTTITHIANFLLENDAKVARDIGQMLLPYTQNGIYGEFFEKPASVDFEKNLVVVECEKLKQQKDLQSVIIQMVMIQINALMIQGDRKTPFMIVIDEAWDLLAGKQTGEFINALVRTIRKYRGSLVIGTQSVNDFYNFPGALAAYENSDWTCLLAQKPESTAILKKDQRFVMDSYLEEQINSIKTVPGKYAEVMIRGAMGTAIGRLVLDPFSRVLYSTKPDEFSQVQEYLKQGMSLNTAISQVAQKLYPEDWLCVQNYMS